MRKIKLARVALNMTQEELAQRVQVSRQTIGLIEVGNYNPSLRLCVSIAKALNQTLDTLFWEDKEDEQQ